MSSKKNDTKSNLILENKKSYAWVIPILAVIPVAVMCVIMIREGVRLETSGSALFFVGEGGVFKYNNLKVFGFPLYDTMLLVGFLVALITAVLRRKIYGMKVIEAVAATVLFAGLVLIPGAKVLAGLEAVADSGKWSSFDMDGFSMFGGMYASVIFLPIFALVFRKNVYRLADFLAPSCLIMLLFTRIGCFCAGCCGASWRPFGGTYIRFPVQLFEVAGDLIILSFGLWLESSRHNKSNGNQISSYALSMLIYCLMRFVIEKLRTNELIIGGLTVAQLHALLFSVIAVIMAFMSVKQKDKKVKKHVNTK